MTEQQSDLSKLYRLIAEQNRAVGGRLTEEKAGRCRERAERIAQLLERVKQSPNRSK